ncbi:MULTISPECIES: hypothetical protein [Salinicola]|jgi:hypothetical protein|uniref:hypothetical protein n=1 Tax=Salinicola TaxID=404432 RepID=UPI00094E5A46|nr:MULTISPECIES: hypothetical protein [Salinicola]OLO09603.1 hypothetical protein BTW08_00490 [Salinicola sp. MH3R3-1]
MAIDAVGSSNATSDSTTDSQAFDDALDNAKFQETMNEGMVQVGGQLILMPMMKDMLSEAMSGGED